MMLFVALVYQNFDDRQDIMGQIKRGEPGVAKIKCLVLPPLYSCRFCDGAFLNLMVLKKDSAQALSKGFPFLLILRIIPQCFNSSI